jgi:hypothetical protein
MSCPCSFNDSIYRYLLIIFELINSYYLQHHILACSLLCGGWQFGIERAEKIHGSHVRGEKKKRKRDISKGRKKKTKSGNKSIYKKITLKRW